MSYTYMQLGLEPSPPRPAEAGTDCRPRAIEHPDFPFEVLSDIAEQESWRKEINRPVYHLHKWWAQRLGTVFRAILIGANETDPGAVLPALYSPTRYPGVTVFDPFMGSGTTIGETDKLGMRGIGRDINRVAYFAVRNALGNHAREQILATYAAIEHDVAPSLRALYRATTQTGEEAAGQSHLG